MNRQNLTLLALLILGLAIRLVDLTDPPLDFHPTRQLRVAIIARGFYYQLTPTADIEKRSEAIAFSRSMGRFEPPLLESLVAVTYKLVGKEQVWIARIFTSLSWIIGSIALFLLARRMTSFRGAIVSLALFLFLPFGVIASRSFQPDPGMVMWIILAAFGFYRWSEKSDWKWAILVGVASGIAILTKVVASYLVLGMAVAVSLTVFGFRKSLKHPQAWVMTGLMILPALIYYILGLQNRSVDYVMNWTVALVNMLFDPSFYVRWMNHLQTLMGLTVVLLSLVGVLLSRPVSRSLLIGLWIGYGVYGLSLPHQIITHSYYSLQLVPIVALSLAPIADLLIERISQQTKAWQLLFLGLGMLALAYPLWYTYSIFTGEDFRTTPAFWKDVADEIPSNGNIIALTQDYGYPLMYYGWRKASLWPNAAERNLAVQRGHEQQDFQQEFAERTVGKDFFLVTAFDQLDRQKELKEMLSQNYPALVNGDGYIVFDLRSSLDAP